MKNFRGIIGVAFSVFLTACHGPQGEIARQAPEYRFDPPLYFNVKNMDVVNSYVAPKKEPYVDHLMPYSLDDALVEWAHHRLRAAHTQGYGVVVIEAASLKHRPLPVKKSLMTTFVRQESDEYEAHGAVRIDFMDHKGYPTGSVFAQAKHKQTVLENTPLSHLQEVWSSLSHKVVEDISHQLEKNIRREIPKLLQD